jgi:copper chaperone CopZ
VSVALNKLEGVESVKVSLNEGSADVRLKRDNRVTVGQIRDVIRKNGFTPKQSEVRLVGKLTERNGKAALEVVGTDVVYLLAEHPRSGARTLAHIARLQNKTVAAEGELAADEAPGVETLLVRQIVSASGGSGSGNR